MSEIEDRLARLTYLELSIQKDIEILKNEEDTPSQEVLNASIKNNLQKLQTKIEAMDQLAEEQSTEAESRLLKEKLTGHRHVLDSLKSWLRKAQLGCRANMEKQKLKNRELLFRGSTQPSQLEQATSMSASLELTRRLQRTRQLLADEIERSQAALQTFDKSSQTLKDTVNEYKGQVGIMRVGRMLLNKISRRQLTDRFLISFGLLFLVLVCLWIISRRLPIGFAWSLISSPFSFISQILFSSSTPATSPPSSSPVSPDSAPSPSAPIFPPSPASSSDSPFARFGSQPEFRPPPDASKSNSRVEIEVKAEPDSTGFFRWLPSFRSNSGPKSPNEKTPVVI
eukprot:TRINITY_DN549_c0_g4_i2.p1 TRINITY_DN549_c0_g4~~TRINITY_DN549_c0_g4_i2.p1  ORF type:complete len:340 (+),score=3.51 TRINITY_DN549_c0_g4_i2:85-1104(+)